MNRIQNNLRQYRLKAGLRQLDVAHLLGTEFTDRLSRWENGLAMPNITNLFRLAELYKVPPEKLYLELRQSISREFEQDRTSAHPSLNTQAEGHISPNE